MLVPALFQNNSAYDWLFVLSSFFILYILFVSVHPLIGGDTHEHETIGILSRVRYRDAARRQCCTDSARSLLSHSDHTLGIGNEK